MDFLGDIRTKSLYASFGDGYKDEDDKYYDAFAIRPIVEIDLSKASLNIKDNSGDTIKDSYKLIKND